MSLPFKILRLLPLPTETKAEWRRALLDRAYAKDIHAARKSGHDAKVLSLMDDHRFELRLDDEEEDEQLTRYLVRQARRLYVPTPPVRKEDGSESEYWYEGSLTFRRFLTPKGVAVLREEIRKERKARHELKSVWLPWLSAVTGILGAATGLVALLLKSAIMR